MLKLTSTGLSEEAKRKLTDHGISGASAVGTFELLRRQKSHKKLLTAGTAVGGVAAMLADNRFVSAVGSGMFAGAIFHALAPSSNVLFKSTTIVEKG
jgi:hypothetical protein